MIKKFINYRIIVHLIFSAVLITSLLLLLSTGGNEPSVAAESIAAKSVPTLTPTPTPIVEPLPVQIQIPDLGIDTAIQSVGQVEEGKMAVPTNFTDAGWYNLGPRPGEKGNALMDGHYDTSTGAPAVFYYLKTLQVGSKIIIIGDNGKKMTFRVINVASYPTDNFPFELVTGATDARNLNLITCAGQWDAVKRDYSERLVVFSQLESESF